MLKEVNVCIVEIFYKDIVNFFCGIKMDKFV